MSSNVTRKQYVFIDGIPSISKNFHACSWNQSLSLLWLYGLAHLVAFCCRLEMHIYCIWWHPQSQLYLLQTLCNASLMIGCYNINNIMIDGVDLENCAHIIQILPCSFETDQHAKTEGFRKLLVVICRGSSPITTLPGNYRKHFHLTLNKMKPIVSPPLHLPSILQYKETPQRWYTIPASSTASLPIITLSTVALSTVALSTVALSTIALSTVVPSAVVSSTVAPSTAAPSIASSGSTTETNKCKTGLCRYPRFQKRQKVGANDLAEGTTNPDEGTVMHNESTLPLVPAPIAEPSIGSATLSAGTWDAGSLHLTPHAQIYIIYLALHSRNSSLRLVFAFSNTSISSNADVHFSCNALISLPAFHNIKPSSVWSVFIPMMQYSNFILTLVNCIPCLLAILFTILFTAVVITLIVLMDALYFVFFCTIFVVAISIAVTRVMLANCTPIVFKHLNTFEQKEGLSIGPIVCVDAIRILEFACGYKPDEVPTKHLGRKATIGITGQAKFEVIRF
ncbi:hypothetical protein BS47DRAFT_1388787 [Hydnum rufescens UP504]|uniref:Uncharacterized protein n=1 Tax=Hydnum rufescens UP504 TaxID=1448309 RepID=A0A9P6B6H0_9AGAM|nr:hypothetical protein BS47DRAFT_1388787 [Hydnum rufescens UP504]